MSVPQTSSLPALQRGVFLSPHARAKLMWRMLRRPPPYSSACLAYGPRRFPRARARCRRISSISATSIPTIQQDMRYAGANNFTGGPVPGYDAAECVLVRQVAEALKAVQADLKAKGFGLLVYDCYRPTTAVAAFVDWAKLPDDLAGQGDVVSQSEQVRPVSRIHRHALGPFARRHARSHARAARSGG